MVRRAGPCKYLTPTTMAVFGLFCTANALGSEVGRQFFTARVVPKLVENGCPICHANGYVRPQVLVYEDAIKYLAMGDSPDSTVIIYKLANLRSISLDRPTHPGNQRCKTPDVDPCKTIKAWWEVEFGSKHRSPSVKK